MGFPAVLGAGPCVSRGRADRAHGSAMAGRTDEELVFALQSGDVESLSVLIGRWEQPLHRFVYRMVPRRKRS